MVFFIFIDGIHAVGKTTQIKKLESVPERKYRIVHELFIGQGIDDSFHRQHGFNQFAWLNSRITSIRKRLLPFLRRGRYEGDEVVVFDRSLFSACIYSMEVKDLLEKIVVFFLVELKKKGVEILTVCLKREREDVWRDVQERLKRDPDRGQYREESREHFDACWEKYYKTHVQKWDCMYSENYTENLYKLILKK